jgi:hypothetical protein
LSTISKYFIYYADEGSEVLKLEQAKKFFALILDLNYKKERDRNTFRKIMKIVDLDNQNQVKLDNVLEFFKLPNFL